METIAILFVDDEKNDREHAANFARKMGHTVKTVASAEAALAKLQTEHFDLLMLDLVMPQMDGYELTHQIRLLDNNNSKATIIALSRASHPEDVKQCFKAGMNNFILKPFNEQKLLAALKLTYFRKREHYYQLSDHLKQRANFK